MLFDNNNNNNNNNNNDLNIFVLVFDMFWWVYMSLS